MYTATCSARSASKRSASPALPSWSTTIPSSGATVSVKGVWAP